MISALNQIGAFQMKKIIMFLVAMLVFFSTGATIVYADDANETKENIFTYTIPEDNAYFPSMTIPEIQEWYTAEATKFVESGKLDVTLETLQDDVSKWSDWITRKNDSILNPEYRWIMKEYNSETAGEFYDVQKKIYDFLWDFYKETGKGLNFSTWVYNIPTATPEPTPTPELTPTPVPTATPEPAPKEDETAVSDNEPVKEPLDDTPTNITVQEKSSPYILLWAIVGIVCIVCVSGVLFFVLKKNKKK